MGTTRHSGQWAGPRLFPNRAHGSVLSERRLAAVNDAEDTFGSLWPPPGSHRRRGVPEFGCRRLRSEEHTSELQSRRDLVCRLLLEKKKKKQSHLLSQKKKKNTTQ